jgi:hypothetical protein
MLAHQGAADESLALFLVFSALWVGWTAASRLRHTGFPRMPVAAAYGLLVVAVGLLVASATVPRAIFPRGSPSPSAASGPRPTSTATLAFTRPVVDATIHGDELEVVLDLAGGRIVDTTSTTLTPDTGHIHLSLDGRLVSMTYGTVQVVELSGLAPGRHSLVAEFVAADHAPFDPRVMARVTFTKDPKG